VRPEHDHPGICPRVVPVGTRERWWLKSVVSYSCSSRVLEFLASHQPHYSTEGRAGAGPLSPPRDAGPWRQRIFPGTGSRRSAPIAKHPTQPLACSSRATQSPEAARTPRGPGKGSAPHRTKKRRRAGRHRAQRPSRGPAAGDTGAPPGTHGPLRGSPDGRPGALLSPPGLRRGCGA